MKRKASAVWHGTGKDGNGHLSTKSTVLNETPYNYSSRFEEGIGTNPEELIAAAHAGCFTMKLSFVLTGAGFEPGKLETQCAIHLESGRITKSELSVVAEVEGIDESKFGALVEEAKNECPVSKLLNADINVTYSLK